MKLLSGNSILLTDDHEPTEETVDRPEWIDEEMDLILSRDREESSPKCFSSLEMLARTVATLCHEINNPLQAITLSTDILLGEGSNLSPEARDRIKRIEAAAERIRAVIERLREIETIHYRDTAAGKMIRLG